MKKQFDPIKFTIQLILWYLFIGVVFVLGYTYITIYTYYQALGQ